MNTRLMVAAWRERAAEARSQAGQFQGGSISQTILLTIAETHERLADREEQRLDRTRGRWLSRPDLA